MASARIALLSKISEPDFDRADALWFGLKMGANLVLFIWFLLHFIDPFPGLRDNVLRQVCLITLPCSRLSGSSDPLPPTHPSPAPDASPDGEVDVVRPVYRLVGFCILGLWFWGALLR